jgi:hypothetical protein
MGTYLPLFLWHQKYENVAAFSAISPDTTEQSLLNPHFLVVSNGVHYSKPDFPKVQ